MLGAGLQSGEGTGGGGRIGPGSHCPGGCWGRGHTAWEGTRGGEMGRGYPAGRVLGAGFHCQEGVLGAWPHYPGGAWGRGMGHLRGGR